MVFTRRNPTMASKLPPHGHQPKSFEIKTLPAENGSLGTTQAQGSLFHVEKQIEFQDVEMGVLDNGVPYLTGRGLAKMIGIDHGPFHRLTSNWNEEKFKPRGKMILQLLEQSGYTGDTLFLRAEFNGVEVNAFPEPVCLALLEYYAFLADEKRDKAVSAFRALARLQFRDFVYKAVGYSPEQRLADSWKHFHDRVDITKNSVPHGYFGVYGEISPMLVPMITAGVEVNDKLIPDISVGISWSNHWKTNGFDEKFGLRIRYEHNYPDYYPQAKSNPQEPYAYPDAALGEFKKWLRENYIVNKLPTYLTGKVKEKAIPFSSATNALLALSSNSKVTGKALGLGKP
jgi:hypothetical protein